MHTFWLDDDETLLLKSTAEELGMNFSDFIRYACHELANRRGLDTDQNQETKKEPNENK